jgi:hypothetical protein
LQGNLALLVVCFILSFPLAYLTSAVILYRAKHGDGGVPIDSVADRAIAISANWDVDRCHLRSYLRVLLSLRSEVGPGRVKTFFLPQKLRAAGRNPRRRDHLSIFCLYRVWSQSGRNLGFR